MTVVKGLIKVYDIDESQGSMIVQNPNNWVKYGAMTTRMKVSRVGGVRHQILLKGPLFSSLSLGFPTSFTQGDGGLSQMSSGAPLTARVQLRASRWVSPRADVSRVRHCWTQAFR